MDALEQLPAEVIAQVRARAEAEAGDAARDAARDVLGRLGVQGEIAVRPGGLLTIDLRRRGASPTSVAMAQQDSGASERGAEPAAIEWNDTDRCPRIVSQGAA